MADIFMLGVFGGIYIVPLLAVVQQRTKEKTRSRIIAANNVLNALFMVLATGFSMIILASGFTIAELFLLLAIINLLFTSYLYFNIPEFLQRLRSYRLR